MILPTYTTPVIHMGVGTKATSGACAARVRRRFVQLSILALGMAGLAPVTAVRAQGIVPQISPAVGDVPRGTILGTMLFRENSRDSSITQSTKIVGTAQWRFELDSLDWRRKLTLHLALHGPEHAEYIIRTAGASAPRGTLHVKNVPLSHSDSRYFTVKMTVRELGVQRVYDTWQNIVDTITFAGVDSLSPDAVLRGTVNLMGFHSFAEGQHERDGDRGQLTLRILNGSFAATFDPRPLPSPTTMSYALQKTILRRALDEFASVWMAGIVNPSVADSTKDNGRARAYLRSRWSEAAGIDSVAVGSKALYVRLSGRYAPVSCVITYDSNAPLCTTPAGGGGSRVLQWLHF
jgi:hypothetical protein